MAKKEVNTNKENKVKKHFFKDMKAELKKVNWPTRKQLVNNTTAVVVIVFIIVAIVFVLDTVFDLMNQYGITKLQDYVVEHFGGEEENSEENNDETTQDGESSENTEGGETNPTEAEENNTTSGEESGTDTTNTDEQNTQPNE